MSAGAAAVPPPTALEFISRQLQLIKKRIVTLRHYIEELETTLPNERGRRKPVPPPPSAANASSTSAAPLDQPVAAARTRGNSSTTAPPVAIKDTESRTGLSAIEIVAAQWEALEPALLSVSEQYDCLPTSTKVSGRAVVMQSQLDDAVASVGDLRPRYHRILAVLEKRRDAANNSASSASATALTEQDSTIVDGSTIMAQQQQHQPILRRVDLTEDDLRAMRQREMEDIAAMTKEVADVAREMQTLMTEQQEGLNAAEQHVDLAEGHVVAANRELSTASRLAIAAFTAGGALAGAVIAGPMGFLAGAKSASAVAACVAVGGVTGAMATKAVASQVQQRNEAERASWDAGVHRPPATEPPSTQQGAASSGS